MSGGSPIRRIVILADGTGNAFSTQASNIWRLNEALDRAAPDQVVRYIEGVGTSEFRPLAILDGATGIGVPANVRRLYRFLCWNWQPGVDIYLFGFSRGAFTVRTLIGMIASQGLMPTAIDGAPIGRAEMKHNAMAAWRRYRAASAPAGQVWPTVLLVRAVRDRLLAGWDRLAGHRGFAAVAAERDRAGRADIPLCFAGLFDTVEAYGVPIAEMRAPIDKAIWPISFRNRVLSPTVRRARHALALDDERTTFHPVRFDMRDDDPADASARIREVWFPGVHSDVGGGYPDDALALVPLAWMMAEAEAAAPPGRDPLRFRPEARAGLPAESSPLAPIHDSRAGLGTFYRYGPRVIDTDGAAGGAPIIHHAVAEKMVFGTEGYAPLTLPSVARVLMPDGRLHPIAGFEARRYRAEMAVPAPAGPNARDRADEAVQRLNRPNASYVDLTRDLIVLRRVAYFALLAFAVVSVCLPLTAPWLDRQTTAAFLRIAQGFGLSDWATQWQQRLTGARDGLGSNLNDLSNTFGGFVPSYAKGWVQALVAQPFAAAVILGCTAILYGLNDTLKDKIADRARSAWFIDAGGTRRSTAPRPWITGLARRLRKSPATRTLRRLFVERAVPVLTLVLIVGAGLVLVERTLVTYRAGSGALCAISAPEAGLRHPKEGVANLAEGFSPDKPCWPTGIVLERGRTYRLWIAMTAPYLDGGTVAGAEGFTSSAPAYLAGTLLRRWWGADWFQPMARIGPTGDVEWPLVSAEGVTAPPLPAAARVPPPAKAASLCGKTDADPAVVEALDDKLAVRRGFVSQFTAQGSGELFVFVNDVLAAIPFGPTLTCFYDNNGGRGTVTVELVPSPKPPAGQDYDFSAAP